VKDGAWVIKVSGPEINLIISSPALFPLLPHCLKNNITLGKYGNSK